MRPRLEPVPGPRPGRRPVRAPPVRPGRHPQLCLRPGISSPPSRQPRTKPGSAATARRSPGCCTGSTTGGPEPAASEPCSPAPHPRPRSSPHSPVRRCPATSRAAGACPMPGSRQRQARSRGLRKSSTGSSALTWSTGSQGSGAVPGRTICSGRVQPVPSPVSGSVSRSHFARSLGHPRARRRRPRPLAAAGPPLSESARGDGVRPEQLRSQESILRAALPAGCVLRSHAWAYSREWPFSRIREGRASVPLRSQVHRRRARQGANAACGRAARSTAAAAWRR